MLYEAYILCTFVAFSFYTLAQFHFYVRRVTVQLIFYLVRNRYTSDHVDHSFDSTNDQNQVRKHNRTHKHLYHYAVQQSYTLVDAYINVL